MSEKTFNDVSTFCPFTRAKCDDRCACLVSTSSSKYYGGERHSITKYYCGFVSDSDMSAQVVMTKNTVEKAEE